MQRAQARSCIIRCDSREFSRFADLLRARIESLGANTDDGRVVLHIGRPEHWLSVADKINIGCSWWPHSAPNDYRALYRIDRLIVPSAWCAQIAMPRPDQQIHVLPAGIDTRVFAPELNARPRGRLRFLAIAENADDPAAGIDLAGRAFLGADIDASLDIFGYAPTGVSFTDRRIQTRRFIGAEIDLAKLFYGYDALLYPARGDGAGIMALKALACGTPVLHSGQTGMAEFADLGELIASRKVTLHDGRHWHEPIIDLLVQRIATFSLDREKALADSRAARERFAIDAFAARVLEVVHVAQQSRNISERRGVSG